MADKYTFKVVSVCEGGEHLNIDILRNGEAYKSMSVSRSEIQTGNYKTWPEISPLLIAKILKSAGTTTDEEHITAIEGAEIIL